MAPKKKVKHLSRKAVPAKKAGAVKGGGVNGGTVGPRIDRLAANHNQTAL